MAEPDEITFHNGAPEIGQITLFTTEEETRLVFTGKQVSDGAPVRVTATSRTRRVRREEILVVRGPIVERLRVAFIEDVTTNDTNGRRTRAVEPYAGGTFEIERKADQPALSVYDATLTPARLGLAAQITGLYRDFGREGAPIKLPAGPQRVGQRAPEIAESLAAGVMRGATISRVEAPEATLADIRSAPDGARHGRYRVSLKVTAEASGSTIALDLKGTILLRDADGAPLEIRLDGPLRSTPDPGSGNVPGAAGTFKMVQTMVYARP